MSNPAAGGSHGTTVNRSDCIPPRSIDLESLEEGEITVTDCSQRLQWDGLYLEVGTRRIGQAEEIMVNGHSVTLNIDAAPLQFETRSDGAWATVCLAPNTFWIIPEGGPFSIRGLPQSSYASCIVDGRYLDMLAGCHFELDPGIGVEDAVLAQLLRVLIAILDDEAHYSQVLAGELIRSFVNALAVRHGHPAADPKSKGGIAPEQMKALDAWLQAHLHDSLTVSLLAARVGLSAAHFAREFKRTRGLTPWEHVQRLRLEGARASLLRGESVAGVAAQFGFADQSHLSRLFKARFGTSPTGLLKK